MDLETTRSRSGLAKLRRSLRSRRLYPVGDNLETDAVIA
jgi:hypothetical protein